MEHIMAFAKLFGEERTEDFKDKLLEIFLDQIRSDMNDMDTYIFDRTMLDEMVNEVLEECKREIKPIIKETLLTKSLAQLGLE